MEMKHLEPFAWGYMHSPRADAESRIANGFYTFAEEAEIAIDPKEWFPAPVWTMGSYAVNYGRADGITLNPRKRDANIAACPEMEEIISQRISMLRPRNSKLMTTLKASTRRT